MNIPDEAINVAAADLYRRKIYSDNFSGVVGESRDFWLKEAKAVLEAGGPLVEAQSLRDTAERYRGKAKALREVAGTTKTQSPMAVEVLLDLADELDRDAQELEKRERTR